MEELLPLLGLGDDVVAWYHAMQEPPENLAARIVLLRGMVEPLRGNQLAPLLRSLRSRVQPDGTLSDDASPDLRRIRREIERQQRTIGSSLRQALRRFSGEGSTQEDLITIRGERTLWGKDLERAITEGETRPKVGDLIGARQQEDVETHARRW